jgi:hypothetical protein
MRRHLDQLWGPEGQTTDTEKPANRADCLDLDLCGFRASLRGGLHSGPSLLEAARQLTAQERFGSLWREPPDG